MHLIDFLYDKNKKYDLIVMNNVLYTLENQSEVIKLLQKRITDNGRILIANPTTASSWPLLREHVQNTPFHQLIPKGLVMVFFYDTLLSTLGTAGSYHFATPRQLRRWITAAKLEVIGTVQRCYGGHQRGIDAVVTVKKSSGQL